MSNNIQQDEFPFDTFSDSAESGDFPDLFELAFCYKWYLGIALVCGVVLGEAAYRKSGPLFEATAQVLVSKAAATAVRNEETNDTGARSEHIALIMSPLIVEQAVEQGQLGLLASFRASDNPVEDIVDNLKVKRSAGQDRSVINVLDLTFRNSNSDDAKSVVQAVIQAYQSYLKQSQLEHTAEVRQVILDSNENLQKQIAKKEESYLKFRESTPLHWQDAAPWDEPGRSSVNVHQDNLVALDTERRVVLIRIAEVKSRVRVLENAQANGESKENLEFLVRQFIAQQAQQAAPGGNLAQNLERDPLEGQLLPLLLEEKRLMRDYGPDHPEVRTIQKSIQTITAFYKQRGISLPDNIQNSEDAKIKAVPYDLVSVYMNSLKQQLLEFGLRSDELAKIHGEESLLAKEIQRFQEKDHMLSAEITRMKNLWQVVLARLNELDLVGENQGYRLKQIAKTKTEVVFKEHLKFIGGGGVFGLCGIFGFIFLKEMKDKSLKSLADARKVLTLPILGGIPSFAAANVAGFAANSEEQSELQSRLIYLSEPHSAVAEAIRSVRAAVFVSAQSDNAKVLMVSSPAPADGKTTLVSNLAVAIAQTGKKVLLIDADLRKPSIHQLFESQHNVGLDEVLLGEIQFQNAVQQSSIERLSFMTAGIGTQQPAELLASNKLESVLKESRERFDYILIDSPPILAVSDACILGRKVDSLLLVLNLQADTRDDVRKSEELIERHGLNVLGVVTNQVQLTEYNSYHSISESAASTPSSNFSKNKIPASNEYQDHLQLDATRSASTERS